MKKVKKVIGLVNYNLKTLVGFEAIYKILTLLIFMPLFLNLFNLITKVTGYDYLTLENFLSFLTNPVVIILLIILFLFMTLYTLFDIASIIVNKNREAFTNQAIKIDCVLVLITILIPIFLLWNNIEMDLNFVPIFFILYALFYYLNNNANKL